MSIMKKEYKDLPLVPESVLKRRHDLDDLRRKREAQLEFVPQHKRKHLHRKGNYVIKPNSLLASSKTRRNHEIRYMRVKKKGMQKRASNKKEITTKEIQVDEDDDADKEEQQQQLVNTITYQANSVDADMVFVVRIREDQGKVPPKIGTILNRFNLKKPYQGVFIKYTPTLRRTLHMIEPWIMYGKPSEAMIKDLMERRSFGNINGERIPLSDNTILEKHLGADHGIICMEDLIHELVSVGDGFEAASKFLWPFQLTCPRSKFEKEQFGARQGKVYGDKGEEMDSYIKQML